jgi:hypothetical protein
MKTLSIQETAIINGGLSHVQGATVVALTFKTLFEDLALSRDSLKDSATNIVFHTAGTAVGVWFGFQVYNTFLDGK